MEQQKISVIVPVYKVEAFLDRCVQSITAQTYRNLEIILVDDGSPDNCPAMCDAWAEKDSRIKVIHKGNGGLSDARNAGMAIAAGELIGFVDSDDWIAPDMYQQLLSRMIDDDSDIAACGVEMVWDDGTPSRVLTKPGCCVLNREEAMRAIIEESWLKQPVWYKLYKTNLIRDLLFPFGKYHEDVFWSYRAVSKAQRVSISDQICYYYAQHDNSIMAEDYSLKRLDAIVAKQMRMEFLQEDSPELVGCGQIDLIFSCLYQGQQTQRKLHGADKKQAMAMLIQSVGDCPPIPKEDLAKLSAAHRFWLRMAKINFPLTCTIRNLIDIGR